MSRPIQPAPSGRRLVVTADDLGLSKGVNTAVRRAHQDGILTAASVLAVGRECADALHMAAATPTLDLGVHLALVGEDPPVLTAAEVPTLVDRRGHFPLSYRGLLARAMRGALDPDDMRRELTAQIDLVAATGLPIRHLDTHQHVHLWPAVAQVVCDVAKQYAVPVVRLPRSHGRGPTAIGVGVLSRRLGRRLTDAALPIVGYAGLDEAGAMDQAAFGRALAAVTAGPWAAAEINLHPGEPDPAHDRFSWGYRWSADLATLLDPATRAAVLAAGWRLVGTAALASPNE
jgi:predicted glycoside hydrolase/deacetylase ChbG (UPF0249 family)